MVSMKENIVLVGLMGAGKTTVGRQLARQLNLRFVDSDHEIEARTGVTIPVIFEIEGEEGFRNRESTVLQEIVEEAGQVIATGGGAVLRPQNRRLLKAHGTVVYLRATVDELWQRTRHDRNRPLLQTEDPKAKLASLYGQRDPLYHEVADIVVDTSRQSVQNLVQQLLEKLEHFGVTKLKDAKA